MCKYNLICECDIYINAIINGKSEVAEEVLYKAFKRIISSFNEYRNSHAKNLLPHHECHAYTLSAHTVRKDNYVLSKPKHTDWLLNNTDGRFELAHEMFAKHKKRLLKKKGFENKTGIRQDLN